MSLASGNRALTVESHDRVGALAEDWDQLAKRTGAPPFQRPGWFDAWLDAFGGGRAEILAVRRGEALTGVLPLVRRAGSLRSATNWHTPLFGPVAADAAALAALTAALLRERASRYDISFLDASGPEPAALREAARAAGAKVVERTIARQPFVDVSGDWAAYEARLERKQRKELGRVRRRLENEGELRFEFVSDDERLDALLDEGFAVEGSGWKSAGGARAARVDVRAQRGEAPAGDVGTRSMTEEPLAAQPDSIARNAFFSLAAQIVTSVATAALTIYLVRALGPKSFGTFAIAIGISTLLLLPADFGISNSAARFIAEHRGQWLS